MVKNACVPCTYRLKDEPPLKFSMLIAIDGNNSLKRVERVKRERDENSRVIGCENIERDEGKEFDDEMYISEEVVDQYKAAKGKERGNMVEEGSEKATPCMDTWANLMDDSAKKSLSFFRETGVFVAVCRHGSCLTICDMIKSGEQ